MDPGTGYDPKWCVDSWYTEWLGYYQARLKTSNDY